MVKQWVWYHKGITVAGVSNKKPVDVGLQWSVENFAKYNRQETNV